MKDSSTKKSERIRRVQPIPSRLLPHAIARRYFPVEGDPWRRDLQRDIEELLEHHARQFRRSNYRGKSKSYGPGHVYLFSLEGTALFKIGFAVNVKNRFDILQNGTPQTLRVVHTVAVSNMLASEMCLHGYLAKYQVRGEWFELPPAVVEWFCSLKAEWDIPGRKTG